MTTEQEANETVHLLGNLLTFRAYPEQTGAFALIECRTTPGGGAPPNRHIEDEGFFVIEGQIEFMVGDQKAVHGPGSFVRIPNNEVHSFTNVGVSPSRMLIFNWPGQDHVRFFRAAGDPSSEGADFPEPAPPDVPKLIALGAESQMEFLPPNGTAE